MGLSWNSGQSSQRGREGSNLTVHTIVAVTVALILCIVDWLASIQEVLHK